MYNKWNPRYYDLELYHHGIKGMHWGVRRFQNRDGTLTKEGKQRLLDSSSSYNEKHNDDISFKKNFKFDRVGIGGEKDEGSTFVSYTDNDRNMYRANHDVLAVGAGEVHKLELKSIKDLKIAGKKAQVDALLDYAGDKSISEVLAAGESNNERVRRQKVKEYNKTLKQILKGKKDPEELLDRAFSLYVERNSSMSIELTKRLQQKGYDGVVDLWDANIAECPIYVFDRKQALKTTKSSELTAREIDEEQLKYYKRKGYA